MACCCKDCRGVCVLQDAGTVSGEQGVGPSPSIQSLSAIQAGPGGPHSRKNSERDVSSYTVEPPIKYGSTEEKNLSIKGTL